MKSEIPPERMLANALTSMLPFGTWAYAVDIQSRSHSIEWILVKEMPLGDERNHYGVVRGGFEVSKQEILVGALQQLQRAAMEYGGDD